MANEEEIRSRNAESFVCNKINCHQFAGFIGKLEAGIWDRRDTEKGGLEKVREKLWHQIIVVSRSKNSRRWTIWKMVDQKRRKMNNPI